MKADRYLLPLFPLAAVAGAVGIAALARHFLPSRPRTRAVAFCAAGFLVLAPIVARLPEQRATLGTDTRTLARRWIERNLAPGSMVMSEVYGAEVLSPVGMQLFDADVRGEIARRGGLARVYAVQTVPMYVMRSERSAKYYDLDRLRAADALVVSSAVRERYRGEPGRYAPQLRFYDELARRWPLAARFEPGRGPGPELSIYRNPAATVPFAARRAVPPTDTTIATLGELSGSEGFWYFNLALNHELGGQNVAARECYLLALRFGATEPDTYVHAAVRLASLLRAEGHPGSAHAMLELCAERAPGATQAGALRGALQTLEAGGELATPVAR